MMMMILIQEVISFASIQEQELLPVSVILFSFTYLYLSRCSLAVLNFPLVSFIFGWQYCHIPVHVCILSCVKWHVKCINSAYKGIHNYMYAALHISKCCTNVVQILFKYCSNIVQILCKYCANIVQILCKYCANIEQIL